MNLTLNINHISYKEIILQIGGKDKERKPTKKFLPRNRLGTFLAQFGLDARNMKMLL